MVCVCNFKASESDAQTDEFKTSLKRQNDVLSGDILEELAQNPKITYASGVKVNYEKFLGLAGKDTATWQYGHNLT